MNWLYTKNFAKVLRYSWKILVYSENAFFPYENEVKELSQDAVTWCSKLIQQILNIVKLNG